MCFVLVSCEYQPPRPVPHRTEMLPRIRKLGYNTIQIMAIQVGVRRVRGMNE